MTQVLIDNPKLRGYIVSALRRISSWSVENNRAKDRAKVGRSAYQCENCKKIVKGLKSIQVDHIEPVGPSPYSRNDKTNRGWDNYIEALFCTADNLQVLCRDCHKHKTTIDVRAMRE
jgi:5-methylcytosine-specific restriction endonuclease McrA